jgi:hypothetical protein
VIDGIARAGTEEAGDGDVGVAGEGIQPQGFGFCVFGGAPTGVSEAKDVPCCVGGGDAVDQVGVGADEGGAANGEGVLGQRVLRVGALAAEFAEVGEFVERFRGRFPGEIF